VEEAVVGKPVGEIGEWLPEEAGIADGMDSARFGVRKKGRRKGKERWERR